MRPEEKIVQLERSNTIFKEFQRLLKIEEGNVAIQYLLAHWDEMVEEVQNVFFKKELFDSLPGYARLTILDKTSVEIEMKLRKSRKRNIVIALLSILVIFPILYIFLYGKENFLSYWWIVKENIMPYWAVALATLGGFLLGGIFTERVRINERGKILNATRYFTQADGVQWKITEHEPTKPQGVLILLGASIGALLAVQFLQNWMLTIILSIFSLMQLMMWFTGFPFDVRYLREMKQEKPHSGESLLEYDMPNRKMSEILLAFGIVFFGLLGYQLLKTLGANGWVLTLSFFFLLGFSMLLMLFYGKMKMTKRQRGSGRYCKKCWGKLESGSIEFGRIYNSYEKCRRCGANRLWKS